MIGVLFVQLQVPSSKIFAGDLSHCVDAIVHTYEQFLMGQPTLTTLIFCISTSNELDGSD